MRNSISQNTVLVKMFHIKMILFFSVLCTFFICETSNAEEPKPTVRIKKKNPKKTYSMLRGERPSIYNPCKSTLRVDGKIVRCEDRPVIMEGFPTLHIIWKNKSGKYIGKFLLEGTKKQEGWSGSLHTPGDKLIAIGTYIIKWKWKSDVMENKKKSGFKIRIHPSDLKTCEYRGNVNGGRARYKELCNGYQSDGEARGSNKNSCMCLEDEYLTSEKRDGTIILKKTRESPSFFFRLTLDKKPLKPGDKIEFRESDVRTLVIEEIRK